PTARAAYNHASRESSCYGSCRRRDLHSFPTRRSSDLAYIVPAGIIAVRRPDNWVAALVWLTLLLIAVFNSRANAALSFSDDPLGDRKSTRLNSSHVKSSYAVFCLKKKTDHSSQRLELR